VEPEKLAMLIMITGALIVLALLIKAGLRKLRLPPMLGFLLVGFALRLLDERYGCLGSAGREVMHFLGILGVIVLLFRVGLESDLAGLVKQLRCASVIWFANVAASAALGYLAARYLLRLEFIPSLVVATAMTATSVGIPSLIWRDAKALDSEDGERFIDVAELDDISGVILMALLFAVLPALKDSGTNGIWAIVGKEASKFAVKLVLFAGGCYLFSRYVEKRLTGWLRQFENAPSLMLIVAGIGFMIAAAAGLIGFSAAIGAFFAGLAFSRDPKSVDLDASFGSVYELFSPFFFYSIGLLIDPGALTTGLVLGSALVVAAIGGKLLGTVFSARLFVGWTAAAVLGVSLVPRAEITLLIMRRSHAMGEWAAPAPVYAGMVFVALVTCVAVPPVLHWMLRKRQKR